MSVNVNGSLTIKEIESAIKSQNSRKAEYWKDVGNIIRLLPGELPVMEFGGKETTLQEEAAIINPEFISSIDELLKEMCDLEDRAFTRFNAVEGKFHYYCDRGGWKLFYPKYYEVATQEYLPSKPVIIRYLGHGAFDKKHTWKFTTLRERGL